jgi:hypothetical protein
MLREILRVKGEEQVSVGSEVMSGQEALAAAVWQFVTTGEVWLQGKKLEATTITEWLSAVKWLYNYVEPAREQAGGTVPEMRVNIIRVEKPYVNKAHPLYQAQLTPPPDPLPEFREGEEDGEEWDD